VRPSKKVIIASQNPVKIEATRKGFEKMFPKRSFSFKGISVSSGVSDQPYGEEETLKGATNRAYRARKVVPAADYWVGIEGGVGEIDGELASFAWVVVVSKKTVGRARSAAFFLPPAVASLIKQGKELGEADDLVFKKKNSKQKMGAIGILTDGVIDRTQYYYQAMVMALIPFKKKNLY